MPYILDKHICVRSVSTTLCSISSLRAGQLRIEPLRLLNRISDGLSPNDLDYALSIVMRFEYYVLRLAFARLESTQNSVLCFETC